MINRVVNKRREKEQVLTSASTLSLSPRLNSVSFSSRTLACIYLIPEPSLTSTSNRENLAAGTVPLLGEVSGHTSMGLCHQAEEGWTEGRWMDAVYCGYAGPDEQGFGSGMCGHMHWKNFTLGRVMQLSHPTTNLGKLWKTIFSANVSHFCWPSQTSQTDELCVALRTLEVWPETGMVHSSAEQKKCLHLFSKDAARAAQQCRIDSWGMLVWSVDSTSHRGFCMAGLGVQPALPSGKPEVPHFSLARRTGKWLLPS